MLGVGERPLIWPPPNPYPEPTSSKVKLFLLFRGACTLEPTAQEMKRRAAKKEEVSLNFMLLATRLTDSLHGKHFSGLLDYKTCSHINCQECQKSTSPDWCLTRKCETIFFSFLCPKFLCQATQVISAYYWLRSRFLSMKRLRVLLSSPPPPPHAPHDRMLVHHRSYPLHSPSILWGCCNNSPVHIYTPGVERGIARLSLLYSIKFCQILAMSAKKLLL